MMRFFIDKNELKSDNPMLIGENAKHAKVLRVNLGEKITVCDGQSNEALCEVAEILNGEYILKVISRNKSANEAKIKVNIFMALPKADKLEHVIQKATELGASEIFTFPSARSIAKLDEKSASKKLERWQKIAESAAKQSMRGLIPKVTVLKSYKEALNLASLSDKSLLFYENEEKLTLKQALKGGYNSVSIITGPEGGLSESEVNAAKSKDISICTLGKRILRCETAPLCALSAVMYDSGEF